MSNKAANRARRPKMFCLQVMYSEFLTLVHSGNVRTAGIDDQADKIYFSLNGHSSQQAAEAAETASTEASVAAADSTSGETASVLCCAVLCMTYMSKTWQSVEVKWRSNGLQMICHLCR